MEIRFAISLHSRRYIAGDTKEKPCLIQNDWLNMPAFAGAHAPYGPVAQLDRVLDYESSG